MPPYPPGAEPPVGGTQWHSPTRVPGYNYQDWNFTNTVHGPWTQLNFSYGNSRAMATVIVNGYAVQDGGYRNLQAQQGIDQAFLTLNFPDALGDYGTLTWNVGTFQNRYGTMGKYDGGMYETYIFGRTHITGETLTANLTNLDKAGNWQLTLEHGVGAKYDIIPFTNNQTYQIYTLPPGSQSMSQPFLSDMNADYLPYAGSVPQGSTFVHHAHVIAKYQKTWTFGAPLPLHLDAGRQLEPGQFAPAERRATPCRAPRPDPGQHRGRRRARRGSTAARSATATRRIRTSTRATSTRSRIRWSWSTRGAATTSSRTSSARPTTPTPATTRGPRTKRAPSTTSPSSTRSASARWRATRRHWWGDGPDLVLTGVRPAVDRRQHGAADRRRRQDPSPAHSTWDMSTKKLKMGLDAVYTPLYWLGFNARFDWVQPDLDAAYSRTLGVSGGSDKSFEVITARLLFRTQFVTHEQIQLQYAHYWLGDAAYPPYPYEWVARADANMVGLFASMWW